MVAALWLRLRFPRSHAACRYGFLVFADEVYQLLTFPGVTPPPPMMASRAARLGVQTSVDQTAYPLPPKETDGVYQTGPAVVSSPLL